jgi:histidyl-tRNA synthetase
MKSADRLKAVHVLMIGDEELDRQTAVLRNMQTKEQAAIPFDRALEMLKAAARR